MHDGVFLDTGNWFFSAEVLQINHQFDLSTFLSHLIGHLVHERSHEEHPPAARFEEVFLFEGIGHRIRIEAAALVLHSKNERIFVDDARDMDEFLFVAFVPVENSVVDGFCPGHQETIERPIVQPRHFVHFLKKRLDSPDFLLIALAVEVEYLRRRLGLRM